MTPFSAEREAEPARAAVRVRGVVQGVGFRPFLHRLARTHGLSGWVRNTGWGVELEWEGEASRLRQALAALHDPAALPPMAAVQSVEAEPRQPEGGQDFTILPSRAGGQDTLIAPDIAPCPDCLRELRTPGDQRYRYPFLNCTNCGPRFTIVRAVPYDRAQTAMEPFAMCGPCAAEYGDIQNRRYHAQPTCCPDCGPMLYFTDAAGNRQPGDPFAGAQALLDRGGILAIKGLGGFHLACRIDLPGAAQRLRTRKQRRAKPLAVMCRDMAAVRRLCTAEAVEERLLTSPRRPIVLLRKREPGAFSVLSQTGTLGVMLPYTPVHELLFDGAAFDTLVMTSANRSELPVSTQNEEALAELREIADGFLLHDRDIEARCDDSLVQVVDGVPCFLRRSRGWVPQPILLAGPVQEQLRLGGILALGAEQKASFALSKGGAVFYSQHIGDLKNAETLAHYMEQITRFERLFGIRPERLVCDLHPELLSTRTGQERAAREGLPLIQIQHHHAHMVSCMVDNDLTGNCIGLVWDGTGYGTDGTIWGSELLVGGYEAVQRRAALLPLPLIGGDAAIREVGRQGLALAWQAGAEAPLFFEESRQRLMNRMLEKKLNCPVSSGMGRLFDGVYALITGEAAAAYEGQRAVQLEDLASRAPHPERAAAYPLPLLDPEEPDGVRRGDTRPLVRALLADKAAGTAPEQLALRFHLAVIEWGVRCCEQARRDTGLDRVVLSGGVFLNRFLSHTLTERLTQAGFTVYRHRRVSPGDEGIALGQLAAAAAQRHNMNEK